MSATSLGTATSTPTSTLRICERCNNTYSWAKSTSSLKLTYCNSLCEQSALGFTIDGLLRIERRAKVVVMAEVLLSL